MTPQLYPIPGRWPGCLAITSRPRGGEGVEDEIRGWKNAGIDIVISLLEPAEERQLGLAEEANLVAKSGMQYISFPIPDLEVPSAMPAANALLEAIHRALNDGKNIVVHCRQSVGRSSLVVLGVLILNGESVNTAIDAVTKSRGIPVPETAAQLQWIESFAASRILTAPK
jgi:protein-tyrosine phosphatase